MDRINYVLAIPVWGKTHVSIFLNICIPSMLTADNIPYLAQHSNLSCVLYVRESEEETLKQHPSMQKLAQLINVEYKHIKFIPGRSNHNVLSDCHRLGLEAACNQDGYAIMPPPDSVWSHNALRNMHQLVEKGIKVIHMACLRLQLEFSYADLTSQVNADGVLDFAPKDLVKFTMPRMHPICKSHFYNYYPGGIMPANLLWHVDNAGIIAHCFHLHPILIKPSLSSLDFKITIDDDLLLGDAYAPHEVHIVQNSNEMLAYEISPRIHFVHPTGAKNDLDAMVKWATFGTNAIHRELVLTPIYLHYDDLKSPLWAQIAVDAKQVVEQLVEKLRIADEIGQYRKVGFKKQLWGAYSEITDFTVGVDHMVLGRSAELRKAHWMYLAETKVYMPIAEQINKITGVKCFIDDDQKVMLAYLRSGFDVFNAFYITRQELLQQSEELLPTLKFETIIYRVAHNDVNLQAVVDAAEHLLQPGGTIVLYTLGNVAYNLNHGNYKLQVIDMLRLGGLGSRLALRIHSRAHASAINYTSAESYVKVKQIIRYNAFGVLAKEGVRMAFVCTKVVLYPIVASLFFALESLTWRNKVS